MGTKFTSLEKKKVIKKTKCKQILLNKNIIDVESNPNDWGNVLHIGYDEKYGDVFKVWDDGEEGFTLYFGEKGDEFN